MRRSSGKHIAKSIDCILKLFCIKMNYSEYTVSEFDILVILKNNIEMNYIIWNTLYRLQFFTDNDKSHFHLRWWFYAKN